jgi:hypothetical protein
MGNTNSNFLVIQTDKATYCGGDVVQGVVCLNLPQEIQANGLYLEVGFTLVQTMVLTDVSTTPFIHLTLLFVTLSSIGYP